MRNDDPEYVAQLERALEAAELEIKGLEHDLNDQDNRLLELQDQLASTRMGEPVIYTADQLAAAVLAERERWKDAIHFYDGDQPRIAFDVDKVRDLWTAAIRGQKP